MPAIPIAAFAAALAALFAKIAESVIDSISRSIDRRRNPKHRITLRHRRLEVRLRDGAAYRVGPPCNRKQRMHPAIAHKPDHPHRPVRMNK